MRSRTSRRSTATWQAQAAETEKLKGSLRQLNDKIEEAKRKRNLLIAKQKRAQAQRRIHETMSGLSDTSAFEAFNRMADKIEEEERRSVAQAEGTEAISGDSLETEFLKLEAGDGGGRGVDDKLMALKQQMGLIAAPEPEERKQLGTGGADGAAGGQDAEVEEAQIAAGPVFRSVNRHGSIGERRLSDRSVADIIKRHVVRLGYDTAEYAGHSLRRGFATETARNGASERTIASTTGHTTTKGLQPYIADAEVMQDPPSRYLNL